MIRYSCDICEKILSKEDVEKHTLEFEPFPCSLYDATVYVYINDRYKKGRVTKPVWLYNSTKNQHKLYLEIEFGWFFKNKGLYSLEQVCRKFSPIKECRE